MKLNRLETHDRLLHLIKDQSDKVQQGAEDCLKRNPLSLAIQDKSPYIYIFGHARTADNGVDKVIYWDPRLSKPIPQTNSFLYRAISKTDLLQECWIIPQEEMWKQYEKGNVTEHATVIWSIEQYLHNRKKLGEPEPDDLPEEKGRMILKQVVDEHLQKIRLSKPFRKI